MQLSVKLRGHCTNRSPTVKLWLNRDCVFDDTVTGDRLFVFDIPAPEKDNLFRIEHWGKDDRETTPSADVAIELLELAFNGIRVLDTVLYNKPYYVNWSRYWPGERPEYVTNTLYFGWNGEYHFDFTDNFDRDYYRQYWLDECQAHENQTSTEFYRDGEFVEVDTGIDATIFDLEKIILNG